MNYLNDWSSFNVPNYVSAKEYVFDNFVRFSRLPQLVDLSDEEKIDVLISYFSKYPDQIQSFNVTTLGRPNDYIPPRFMNIGGVVKYK